jgi:[glutamine synthetase] adenylyltransferase / [glutamine synthetase]-adenylyl-L-tyrosine phosphorylase
MTNAALQLLNRIEAFSPYFTHLIRLRPSLIEKIFDRGGYLEKRPPEQLAGELQREIAGTGDFSSFCLLLRRFKQEEILKIAALDLGGLAGLKEITENLSALAQICLQASIRFCLQEKPGANDPPIPSLEEGLVVLGLGKLGGWELNFSSDIDLIFLYHPISKVPLTSFEQKETLQTLVRKVIQAMGAQMEGDHVFRVDLGLRPGGKDSDLLLSLDSTLEYYQSSAKTWERMALIKARPIAGNIHLGKVFWKEIQPIIYRKFIDYSVLSEIRSMKQKILIETRSPLIRGDNIKLGPGGIREIEFFIQALQLIFGGKVPSIREGNTLRALAKLKDAQLLGKKQYRQLSHGYTFLRTLEHRIQMVDQRQTHTLPRQPEALEGIAGKMLIKGEKAPGSAGLIRELDRVKAEVRIIFDNLLLTGTPVSQKMVIDLLQSKRSPENWKKELKGLGFYQWNGAREIIESWQEKLSASTYREKTFLARLFPLFLSYCLQSVNPDQGLTFSDRFLRSVGGRTAILIMLLERTALVKEIVDLFARSTMMGRLFVQNTEMIEHLVLQRPMGHSEIDGLSLRYLNSREEGKDPEDRLSRLRRWKSGLFLGIALEEISGRLPSTEASEKLTVLADEVLQGSVRLAEETLNREVIHPIYPDRSAPSLLSPFCILGLGKQGGRELGYTSDLDLVFVYSLKAPFLEDSKAAGKRKTSRGDKKRITYHEYLVRLAQRLISYLSLPLREGPGYSVDTRLRPSGSFGPLIVTLDAFQEYYQLQAQNWEKQALLKARVIVGPNHLSKQINEVIEKILYQVPPPLNVRKEIVHFRLRMQKERAGEDEDRFNPKLGLGGLTDIEFIAQYLQWTYGQAEPELRKTNTLEVLRALAGKGHLTEGVHYQLKEAYQFLTALDHGLQLLYDRKDDPRTYSREELTQTAKLNLMGLGESAIPSWDICQHYEKIRKKVRFIFNQVFQLG